VSKRTAVSAKRMRELLLNMAESTALNCGAVSHEKAKAKHLKGGIELAYRYEPTADGGSVLMFASVMYGDDAKTKLAELEAAVDEVKAAEQAIRDEMLRAERAEKLRKKHKKERKRAKKRAQKLGEPE
jgi:hypothetical protein